MLLKPFDADRPSLTLQRARERLIATKDQRELVSAIGRLSEAQPDLRDMVSPLPGASAPLPQPDAYLERIAIKSDGRIVFVKTADIDYIESAANYLRVHVGAESHRVRGKIGEIITKLDPAVFARIHRGTIVSLDRIKEIQPWFSGDALVILRGGERLRLARTYRHGLSLGRAGLQIGERARPATSITRR